MLALLRRVLGPSKRQLKGELDRLREAFLTKDAEHLRLEGKITSLTQRAYDGDALLSQEIDKLNDENDAINHDRTRLKFDNERLRKERDLERTVLAERESAVRAREGERGERAVAGRERGVPRPTRQAVADAYAAKCERDGGVEMGQSRRTLFTRRGSQSAPGKTYAKLLADEKERLRLAKLEVDDKLEQLHWDFQAAKSLYDATFQEEERLLKRVVSLKAELDAVVATASETNAELEVQRQLSEVSLDQRDERIAENAKLRETIGELKEATKKAWAEASGLNDYIDAVDKQISEALEKVGKFPPKPAGAPDRLDAICRELVEMHARLAESKKLIEEGDNHVGDLFAENQRLNKMLAEPEFLKAEARKQGERMVADATMKHWASKMMVMSFHDSLGSAENLVELEIGDNEFGFFIVTVQRKYGKSNTQIIDELREKICTLEIALEASADRELEQEWEAERRRLKRVARKLRNRINHESFLSLQLDKDMRKENNNLAIRIGEVNRNAAEIAGVADDLYVALSDLLSTQTGSPHAPGNYFAAIAQANHYLSLYAPKEKESA